MWTRAFEFNALPFVQGKKPADLVNAPRIEWDEARGMIRR